MTCQTLPVHVDQGPGAAARIAFAAGVACGHARVREILAAARAAPRSPRPG